MGRYLKYLEIVNKIDAAIEKKAAGKVDIDKDLPKIKTMLEVQDLALKMSMCIDRIDDNVRSAFALYAKGDPSARGVVEGVLEKMKESGGMGQSGAGGESANARGRDFRGGRENSESDRGYSTGSWSPQGRSDARGEMNRMDEEDRRGGYRGRRSRSESGHWDEGEDALFDRFNEEDRRGRSARTGRFVHRAEMNYAPRSFWPLTPPGYPFGMSGRSEEEMSRMGFLGDGRSSAAPYNHLPIPDPLKDLPLIGRQGGQSRSENANGAANANTGSSGNAAKTGAAAN